MITPLQHDNERERLIDIWQRSVRATHDFVEPEDFVFYRDMLRQERFRSVEVMVSRDEDEKITGFIGLDGPHIDVLFIDPDYFGQGLGRTLLQYAVRERGCRTVDVNESNTGALGFYLKQGFRIVGRDKTDPCGKPYPILHLSLD